jgi:hypothetical protein
MRLCDSGEPEDHKALRSSIDFYLIDDPAVMCFNRPIVCLALLSKLTLSPLDGAESRVAVSQVESAENLQHFQISGGDSGDAFDEGGTSVDLLG